MERAAYTHGHAESVLRSHRWRTAENSAAHLLPHLRPGTELLDVGCGPGTITVDLARRVAPGRVVAVEVTEAALDLARQHAAEQSVQGITFLATDAESLDLPDDSVDVVHAHQVLQHLGDPVQALREMGRVCRPGGLIAVRDSDYGAFTWFPEVPELDEWLALYRQAARDNGAQPDAGRRLLSWGRRAGLVPVQASSSTWCFADAPDRAWWGGMWADRIVDSAVARQLVDSRAATTTDLQRIAAGWRTWADHEDGWFSVLHGELLAHP